MADHNIVKNIRMTPEELQAIQKKMEQFGTTNFSAFVRKMAIDGYVVKLELPELKELVSLLRYSSNNLNQLTRRVHESGRIYDADLEDIQQNQERLWSATQEILDKLHCSKGSFYHHFDSKLQVLAELSRQRAEAEARERASRGR